MVTKSWISQRRSTERCATPELTVHTAYSPYFSLLEALFKESADYAYSILQGDEHLEAKLKNRIDILFGTRCSVLEQFSALTNLLLKLEELKRKEEVSNQHAHYNTSDVSEADKAIILRFLQRISKGEYDFRHTE